MADLKKLHFLQSISSNSPFFSPSSKLTFPIIHFTPIRRRRSQLSSSSLPDIVSTSEQSDGSVVFKFGNATQSYRSFDSLDGAGTVSELVGASDDGSDVNYTNLELVGGLDDQQDVNYTNLELVGGLGDGQDVSFTNLELVGGLDDGEYVNSENPVLDGASDDGEDATCTNLEPIGASDDEQYVNCTNSELVGALDDEQEVNNANPVLVGALDDVQYINSVNPVLVGASGDGEDVTSTNSELVGASDDEQDVNCTNSELVGALEDEQEVNYMNSELVGALDDGEYVNSTNSVLVGASDDGQHVTCTNSELVGASDDEQDVNCANSELVGALDNEQEINYTNLELVGGLDDGEYINSTNSVLVGASDDGEDVTCTNSELVGALDDEQEVNYVNSELVGALDDDQDVPCTDSEIEGGLADEHEPKSQRGSASDTYIAEVDEIYSKEYTVSKDEEKDDEEVQNSTESKAEEIKVTGVSDIANGNLELEENVLGGFKQVGELVGSTDSSPELEFAVQPNVDCSEDEQNYGLISTVEIEMKHDGERSSVTISDSNVDLTVENSSDSEMVNNEKIESVVLTLDCNEDLTVGNLEQTSGTELVVDVMTSQLQLDVNGLQEISETSSRVEVSEPPVSPDESEFEGNGGDDDNVMPEIAETNSGIGALEIGVSLDEDELDNHLKQVANEENVDDKSQDILEMNLLIEVSDRNVQQVENEENVDGRSQEIVDMKALTEASDGNVKQMANEENFDDQSQEIVDMNPLIDALDRNVKLVVNEEDDANHKLETIDTHSLIEGLDMGVSLEDDEPDRNVKHVGNEEDVGNDMLELFEIKASHISVSLEDVQLDSNVKPVLADEEEGDDKLQEIDMNLLVEVPQKNVSIEEIATPALYLSSAAASFSHSSEASTGGMDAYFVCKNWFGVADGVGQWSFRGTDRGRYAHELMQNCEKVALDSQTAGLTDVKDALQQIAAMTESSGAARVLIAHFANHALHVANIGDTGFLVVRNGKIFKKSFPMVHEFNFPYAIGFGVDPLEALEEYHIELEDGDVVVAATDGLFDNLYEQEIASVLSKSLDAGMELKELAELLVTIAQELGSSVHGRSPFADAAQAAGHTGVVGGKLDHVTVIVSLVQTSSN